MNRLSFRSLCIVAILLTCGTVVAQFSNPAPSSLKANRYGATFSFDGFKMNDPTTGAVRIIDNMGRSVIAYDGLSFEEANVDLLKYISLLTDEKELKTVTSAFREMRSKDSYTKMRAVLANLIKERTKR